MYKTLGTIKEIQPVISGTSNGKDWKKQNFIIETEPGQYPKTICMSLFGDKTSVLSYLSPGCDVDVSFSIESRQYQDKWFTNVNAFSVTKIGGQQVQQPPNPPKFEEPQWEKANKDEDNSDLPF
jgi:hypothetical protein